MQRKMYLLIGLRSRMGAIRFKLYLLIGLGWCQSARNCSWPETDITTMTSCSLVSCRHSLRASWSIDVINWVEHSVQYSSLHRHPPLKTMQFFLVHSWCHCAQQPYPQYPTHSYKLCREPQWLLLQKLWRQTLCTQRWWMLQASQKEEETCMKHGSGQHLLYLGPCYILWTCLYCAYK